MNRKKKRKHRPFGQGMPLKQRGQKLRPDQNRPFRSGDREGQTRRAGRQAQKKQAVPREHRQASIRKKDRNGDRKNVTAEAEYADPASEDGRKALYSARRDDLSPWKNKRHAHRSAGSPGCARQPENGAQPELPARPKGREHCPLEPSAQWAFPKRTLQAQMYSGPLAPAPPEPEEPRREDRLPDHPEKLLQKRTAHPQGRRNP